MSVVLHLAPDEFSFSKNFITAEFQCTDYLQQVGRRAISVLKFISLPVANSSLTLIYGSHKITMAAVDAPGATGTDLPVNSVNAADLVPYFRKNFYLNRDFDITSTGSDSITFTSKSASTGLDISVFSKANINVSITNTQTGLPELKKPNYSVAFRLFIENISNTGFEKIYESNLMLRNDRPGMVVAQLGDKLNQVLEASLINYGIEIPTNNALKCSRTSRRYYFEFAESFGDPIQVQSVQISPMYYVLYGGQSYQAANKTKLQDLLRPGVPSEDRFLRLKAKVQLTRENQPQYLFFFNTRDTSAARLMAKRTFNDGTSDTVTLSSFNLDKGVKYGFNASYGSIFFQTNRLDQYEIYLINTFNERISEVQTFIVDRKLKLFQRCFMSYSSLGSFESRLFTGKIQSAVSLNYEKSQRIRKPGYNLVEGDAIVHSKSLIRKFKASTGFIDVSEVYANQDFFLSLFIYRWTGKSLLPIEITSQTMDNPPDESFLCSQIFEYQYLFTDDCYSEIDQADTFTIPGALPAPIGPIIIYAGTPANPSLQIVHSQIP